MVWYQKVAWAVNYGLPSYLDSMLALRMCRDLPQAEQAGHGVELLESGLALNPFNITLAIAAEDACDSPEASRSCSRANRRPQAPDADPSPLRKRSWPGPGRGRPRGQSRPRSLASSRRISM